MVLLAVAQLSPQPASAEAPAVVVPPSFQDTVITQFSGPTGLAFTTDGRLLITAKTGSLRVFKDGALLPTPAINISAKVCSDSERGLLGVGVDPSFAANQFVYLFYTFRKFGTCPTSGASTPVNRISRFMLPPGNVIDPATEVVLVDNMPSVTGVHNAGDFSSARTVFFTSRSAMAEIGHVLAIRASCVQRRSGSHLTEGSRRPIRSREPTAPGAM